MKWPFRKSSRKDKDATVLEPLDPSQSPPGQGWRHWFELSARAAHDPPWNYEQVELWRPSWDRARVTRSADIPYEMNGPGFWWRPLTNAISDQTLIEGEWTNRSA